MRSEGRLERGVYEGARDAVHRHDASRRRSLGVRVVASRWVVSFVQCQGHHNIPHHALSPG